MKQFGGVRQIFPAPLDANQNRSLAGRSLEDGVNAAIALNGNNRQAVQEGQSIFVRLNIG